MRLCEKPDRADTAKYTIIGMGRDLGFRTTKSRTSTTYGLSVQVISGSPGSHAEAHDEFPSILSEENCSCLPEPSDQAPPAFLILADTEQRGQGSKALSSLTTLHPSYRCKIGFASTPVSFFPRLELGTIAHPEPYPIIDTLHVVSPLHRGPRWS